MAEILWRSQWMSVERAGPGAEEAFAADDEVQVVALDEAGRLLLVEEPSPAFGEAVLVLPGGVVEVGESPLVAAQRELREETGLRAGELTLVGAVRPWPKYLRVTSHIVRAAGLAPDPLPPDEPQPPIPRPTPLADVHAAIRRGALADARLIAALALAGLWP